MSGTVLPELSNPAGAANIQSGYQAINGEGEVVTGTAAVRETVEIKVINNSAEHLEVSGVLLSSVMTNFQQLARTEETYSCIKKSIFCVKSNSGRSINVESTQIYATLINEDDLYAEAIYDSPVVFTVT